MMYLWNFVIFIAIIIIENAQGLYIEKMVKCSSKHFLDAKFGNVQPDGRQKVDMNITTDIDIGENTDVDNVVQIKRGKEWITISKIEYDKGYCEFLNNYAGDLWYDIAEAMGIERQKCPIKAGSYSVKDFPMDYNKLLVKRTPFKSLKAVLKVYLKGSRELLGCSEAYIKN